MNSRYALSKPLRGKELRSVSVHVEEGKRVTIHAPKAEVNSRLSDSGPQGDFNIRIK